MAARIEKVDFNSGLRKNNFLMLLNDYAYHPMGQNKRLSDSQQKKLWSELAERPWIHAFLAYLDNEEAVGVSVFLEGFSTFQCAPLLNIHDLYVADKYQRRGVGRALIESISAEAVRMGCCKVTLEVLQYNHSAKSLYSNAGFTPYSNPEAGAAEFWHKKLI
ncbi:MAG: GNAT family N-acetyltransferase [Acidithiobacillus sp.]